MPGTRLAISEDGRVAKVTIVLPLRDGGISIAAPYTKHGVGLLTATKTPQALGTHFVPEDASTAEYAARNRAKLSLHRSGFAQFSGRGIRSGRDQNGQAKGLAIQMRRPFMYPITTGPTFAVVAWGLSAFEALRKRDADHALVFDQDDYLLKDDPIDRCNGYAIEGFVFPNSMLPHVRPLAPGKTVLPYFHRHYEGRGAHFRFRVMLLPNQSVFLGFLVWRIAVTALRSDGEQASSGSILNGPRDYDNVGLYAFYPSPHADGHGPAASLDWEPAATDEGPGTPSA